MRPLSSRRLLPALLAVLLLAACAGFGRDPGPAAFDQPNDCFDPGKRLHPDHSEACEVPD